MKYLRHLDNLNTACSIPVLANESTDEQSEKNVTTTAFNSIIK